ncbi:MAG: SRPBCC family protein, partial [Acidimicrobiales bacterium]
MDLTNEFRVGVPVEEAWKVLTDVERIAPCMPGAQLQEIEGDEYRGVVKVKVGPITAQYKGAARFVERDEAGHRAVLRAEGRETRGQGNANATITALLEPDGDGTKISVTTDLTITGRVAQFGRGVLADVSAKLLGQFADCLESKLLAGEETGGAGGGAESPSSAGTPASAAGGPRDIASEGAAATLQDVPQGAAWPGQASSGPTAQAAEAAPSSTGDADRA